jgi:U32 family peptidase
MEKRIELMAPTGDFATLVAACEEGADAVYFGLKDFSMRAGKKNFKFPDLKKIRTICQKHPRKPKMYLTLNTIIYDSELQKAENLIKKVKDKVDAVIVSDMAAALFCKENGVPFFISTQLSVSNTKTAQFYKELGAKRVVLARELDIKQIKKIAKIKNLEIEVFVHGAMCVAISGRCFMSQFLFNKSANRGECLHPCRRGYLIKDKELDYELNLQKETVMSAKDLCTLPFIEELKKTGVSSFKIEGRNRDARYVATVTRAYRQAIDKKLSKEEKESLVKELEGVFNRGLSSGFYLGKPLAQDFATVEGSASLVYKDFLGKVTYYYPKIGVALLKLSKDVGVGEKIVFIGEKIGSKEMIVKEIEKEKKKIKKGEKGEEVGIKVPFRVTKNTEVYKIKKRER